jgi:hypothetical protein
MSRRAPSVVTADAVAHAAETSWMPLSHLRSSTVISIASHEPTVWRGHGQEVQKGINSFSGMGAQERDCPRWPEGNAAMAALPGVLGRGWSSGRARPCRALPCRTRSAWRGAGSRISQGYGPWLTCSARWHTSPWPAFRRCGGTPRPRASATAGRQGAGDAKPLALPRRLAYYRRDNERDQRASAAGADDCSPWATPGRHPLRRVGWKRLGWVPFLFPLSTLRRCSRERWEAGPEVTQTEGPAMELWPAIIASPSSTRCTLMDALIIVCLAKSVHRRFVHWTIRRPLRSSLMRARQCVKVVWSDLAETTMSGYGKAHADRLSGSTAGVACAFCV